MKIAVTAAEPSLDAAVDPRFGRCPYFLIVETDDLTFEALENPNLAAGGGAGIQSAQSMSDHRVNVVLTGACGPNAIRTLSAAGIRVVVGCSGLVGDVVNRFKAGQFKLVDQPDVGSHVGAGTSAQSPAPGMGQGGGRGMGRSGGGQRG